MNKLKRVIHLLLPIFMAIYQVYLVDRIWEISKKISLFLFIIIISILYLCYYLIKKHIKITKIRKKTIIIIGIISVLLTSIILSIDFDFFVKKYRNVDITIIQENNKDKKIPIKNIIVDNISENVQGKYDSEEIKLYFKDVKDISIIFQKDYDGNIIIQENSEQIIISEFDNIYQYNIKTNAIMSPFSYIRLILSFILIEIISLTVCFVSYYMYKRDKVLILPILVIVAIIRIIFYQQCSFFIMTPDSFDYKGFDFNSLFSGKLQGRVPIYPIFLKILTFICEESWKNFTTITQVIISFIALIYLYKMLKLLVKWEMLRCVVVFFYGVCVAVIGWDTLVLTESLSLSAIIFFCYFIIKYIKSNSLKYGITAVVLTLFMIFLRPAFIIFIALLFAFFILKLIFEKKNRKKDFKCLVIVVVEIVLILIYAIIFYKQNQIFSISDASLRQNLYVCINEGFYKQSGNEQFIEDIEGADARNNVRWNGMIEILSSYEKKYGNRKIQELINISKKNSYKEYIKYIRRIINENSEIYFNGYQTLKVNSNEINEKYNFVKSFNFLKFSFVYYIMFIEGIINIYILIKNKKINWIYLGLFGGIFSILFVAFVGTNGEFMRTAICVVPLSYISVVTIFGDLIEKYKKNNKKI